MLNFIKRLFQKNKKDNLVEIVKETIPEKAPKLKSRRTRRRRRRRSSSRTRNGAAASPKLSTVKNS